MTKTKAERNKEWRWKKRREADKVFGVICFLCGGITNLCLHKKDGTPHKMWLTASVALKEPEKWVRLCYGCHKAIHWIMEHFGMTWEEIVELYH